MLAALLTGVASAHAECALEGVRFADHDLNAAIAAHDVATARSLYMDAFVLTTSRGTRKSAGDMLRDVANPHIHLRVNETHDVAVIGNPHTAVLYGGLHQKGTFDKRAFDAELLVTDTWTCVDDRWRLLAGQASKAGD